MAFSFFGLFDGLSSEERLQNKQNRRVHRADRQYTRQTSRGARVFSRHSMKARAYESGFDPNASVWEGISSLGSSAAGVFSSVYGKGSAFGAAPNGSSSTGTTAKNTSNVSYGSLAPYGAIALVLIYLGTKK